MEKKIKELIFKFMLTRKSVTYQANEAFLLDNISAFHEMYGEVKAFDVIIAELQKILNEGILESDKGANVIDP